MNLLQIVNSVLAVMYLAVHFFLISSMWFDDSLVVYLDFFFLSFMSLIGWCFVVAIRLTSKSVL